MIIVYTSSESELGRLFAKEDYLIPFADTILLEMSYNFWESALSAAGESIEEVYIPSSWESSVEFSQGKYYTDIMEVIKHKQGRCIIFTDTFSMPDNGIDTELLKEVRNNKGTLYKNIVCSNGGIPNVSNANGIPLSSLSRDNYLETSLGYVEGMEDGHSTHDFVTYGKPVVRGRVSEDSIICGPCFISEDSEVISSTIYSGSIIISSKIERSSTLGSVVNESYLSGSEVRDSIITGSEVLSSIVTSSTLPRGVKLSGRKV